MKIPYPLKPNLKKKHKPLIMFMIIILNNQFLSDKNCEAGPMKWIYWAETITSNKRYFYNSQLKVNFFIKLIHFFSIFTLSYFICYQINKKTFWYIRTFLFLQKAVLKECRVQRVLKVVCMASRWYNRLGNKECKPYTYIFLFIMVNVFGTLSLSVHFKNSRTEDKQ